MEQDKQCQHCDHCLTNSIDNICSRPIRRQFMQTWPLNRLCRKERVWWGRFVGRCGRGGQYYWDASLEFQQQIRETLSDPIVRQRFAMAAHDLIKTVVENEQRLAERLLDQNGMM